MKAILQEAQTQSTAKAQRQKWYYDWKIGTIGLKPGDLVLVKANTFQGKRKIMQGGHGTGKTGNLDVHFSRQGKHREFSYFNFYTGKIVATQGKF